MEGRSQTNTGKQGKYNKVNAERELQRKMLRSIMPEYETRSATNFCNEATQSELTKDEVDEHIEEFVQWTPAIKSEEQISISSSQDNNFSDELVSEQATDEAYVMPDFLGIKFSEKPKILLKDSKKKTTITLDSEKMDVDEIKLKVSDWPIGELYLSIGGFVLFPRRSSDLPDFLVISTEYRNFSLDEAMFHGNPQHAERERAAWQKRERKENQALSSLRLSSEKFFDEGRRCRQYSFEAFSKNGFEVPKSSRYHNKGVQTLVQISTSNVSDEKHDSSESSLKKVALEIMEKEKNISNKSLEHFDTTLSDKTIEKQCCIPKAPCELKADDSLKKVIELPEVTAEGTSGRQELASVSREIETEKKKKKVQLKTPSELEEQPEPVRVNKPIQSALKRHLKSVLLFDEDRPRIRENVSPENEKDTFISSVPEFQGLTKENSSGASASLSQSTAEIITPVRDMGSADEDVAGEIRVGKTKAASVNENLPKRTRADERRPYKIVSPAGLNVEKSSAGPRESSSYDSVAASWKVNNFPENIEPRPRESSSDSVDSVTASWEVHNFPENIEPSKSPELVETSSFVLIPIVPEENSTREVQERNPVTSVEEHSIITAATSSDLQPRKEQNPSKLCSCSSHCLGLERPPGTLCQEEQLRRRLYDPRTSLLQAQQELARPFSRNRPNRSSLVSDPYDILEKPPEPKK